MGKEPCEEFKRDVARIKRRKHSRLPRGYKKDPREYETGTLLKEITCEDCNSWRKTGEITIHGITRQEPKSRICKQDGICSDWTPFPMETEGSTDESE